MDSQNITTFKFTRASAGASTRRLKRMSQHKKSAHIVDTFLAEAEGFEPPVPCGTPVFKTGAIDQLCQTSRTAKVAHPISNSSGPREIQRRPS